MNNIYLYLLLTGEMEKDVAEETSVNTIATKSQNISKIIIRIITIIRIIMITMITMFRFIIIKLNTLIGIDRKSFHTS